MVLEGSGGVLALGLPLAVLLLVVILDAVSSWRRRRRATAPMVRSTGRYGAPVSGPGPGGSGRREPERPAAAPVAGPAAPRSQRGAAARSLDEILVAIAQAEAIRDEPRLASLYLEAARGHAEAGRIEMAADLLRQSIRIATRLGLKSVHAAARLEIGDISRAGGDLTTACEHWQIARGLFFDLGSATELEETEGRMRGSGCPTDWVLNDF